MDRMVGGSAQSSISVDNFDGWCDIPNLDAFVGSCGSPSTTDYDRFSPLISFSPQNNLDFFSDGADDVFRVNETSTSYNSEERMVFEEASSLSLHEKMEKVLSFFMESPGRSNLAQVWVPRMVHDQCLLVTSDQPYLVDQLLSGYREVSKQYIFPTNINQDFVPGLPGRVFIFGYPESTSNIRNYSKEEFLRLSEAIDNNVRGAIAFPIFEAENPCCAVLEVVTIHEKPNFDFEIENVCRALQAVNLRTTNIQGQSSQTTTGSIKKRGRKKKSTNENITLSVIQQHFSGTLQDAAKSIGVCATTLQRMCRVHGISRWPSRQISKVNRSLKNVKTIMDSVPGVKEGLVPGVKEGQQGRLMIKEKINKEECELECYSTILFRESLGCSKEHWCLLHRIEKNMQTAPDIQVVISYN